MSWLQLFAKKIIMVNAVLYCHCYLLLSLLLLLLLSLSLAVQIFYTPQTKAQSQLQSAQGKVNYKQKATMRRNVEMQLIVREKFFVAVLLQNKEGRESG